MNIKNGFFLITGTSRGIGEALAQQILENGNTVLGVSRSQSNRLTSSMYHHVTLDLLETSQLNQITKQMQKIIERRNFEFICLINNASAVDPIGPIEKCSPTEIDAHVRIGLIAPMILTSLFIREFAHADVDKKVVFISSGAAFKPIEDESIYCASKAGSHMFARTIGLEQKSKKHGFEVFSIGPGMVDTPMQQTVRSKSSEEFAMADFFQQAYLEGKLKDPNLVAAKIYKILGNKHDAGSYVNVADA